MSEFKFIGTVICEFSCDYNLYINDNGDVYWSYLSVTDRKLFIRYDDILSYIDYLQLRLLDSNMTFLHKEFTTLISILSTLVTLKCPELLN